MEIRKRSLRRSLPLTWRIVYCINTWKPSAISREVKGHQSRKLIVAANSDSTLILEQKMWTCYSSIGQSYSDIRWIEHRRDVIYGPREITGLLCIKWLLVETLHKKVDHLFQWIRAVNVCDLVFLVINYIQKETELAAVELQLTLVGCHRKRFWCTFVIIQELSKRNSISCYR